MICDWQKKKNLSMTTKQTEEHDSTAGDHELSWASSLETVLHRQQLRRREKAGQRNSVWTSAAAGKAAHWQWIFYLVALSFFCLMSLKVK